jgi:hypothetical protein
MEMNDKKLRELVRASDDLSDLIPLLASKCLELEGKVKESRQISFFLLACLIVSLIAITMREYIQ